MRSTPLTALATALLVAACTPETKVSADPSCLTRSSDKIGGPFSLISHTGERITEANFRGRKTLVFFGFTYCPDVCPQTLYSLGSALSMMPEGVPRPLTALISVDPERDTPEALGRYIASTGFPSDIVALTGDQNELKTAAAGFAASFERVEDPDSQSGYLMNHTSIIYLMDEDWRLKTFFTPDARPEDIARCLQAMGG